MFLEYEKDPVKQTDDLSNCPSCDYPLGEIADDRRCSECGLLMGAGSRLIYLNRKRSWRGWALIKKLTFLLMTILPSVSTVILTTRMRLRLAAAQRLPPPTQEELAKVFVAAVLLSILLIVLSLVIWWAWFRSPRCPSGLIFGTRRFSFFGKGRAPFTVDAEKLDVIELNETLALIWGSELNTSTQNQIKLPGVWMSFRNLRRAILQEIAILNFRGRISVSMRFRRVTFHQQLRGLNESIRKRHIDHQNAGRLILGPPSRSHPPILCLYLLVTGLFVYLAAEISEFKPFPVLSPILESVTVSQFVALAIAVATYYLVKQYIPIWGQFLSIDNDGLTIEKHNDKPIQVRWDEVRSLNYSKPKAASTVNGLTMQNGKRLRFCAIYSDEARLLEQILESTRGGSSASFS